MCIQLKFKRSRTKERSERATWLAQLEEHDLDLGIDELHVGYRYY